MPKGIYEKNRMPKGPRSEITKQRIGDGHRGKFVSQETKDKMKRRMLGVCGEKAPAWIDGRSFLPYSRSFNSAIKKSIRLRDNYTCKGCGLTESKHLDRYDIRLHIHHIDYNKQNCELNNLVTVCISCNSKANANREFWTNYYNNLIK